MNNEKDFRIKDFLERKSLTFENHTLDKENLRFLKFLKSISYLNPTNDIAILSCGKEQCRADKLPIEKINDKYCLHYIVSGQGVYENNGNVHELKAGDIFLAIPGEKISYFPNKNNPWSYIYIVFWGICQDALLRQMGFLNDVVIMHTKKNNKIRNGFFELYERVTSYGLSSIKCLGLLYEIFANIMDENIDRIDISKLKSQEQHIIKAMSYIGNNFNANISVNEVAKNISLNPQYLTKIFRKVLGITLKEYITIKKLEIANDWLYNTNLKIAFICEKIGFNDWKYFIKVYKKYYGVTPNQNRQKKHKNRNQIN